MVKQHALLTRFRCGFLLSLEAACHCAPVLAAPERVTSLSQIRSGRLITPTRPAHVHLVSGAVFCSLVADLPSDCRLPPQVRPLQVSRP